MNFDDMKQAVAQAKGTLNAADSAAGTMADLLVGRLRTAGVGYYTLRRLKQELSRYNAHTRSWRD